MSGCVSAEGGGAAEEAALCEPFRVGAGDSEAVAIEVAGIEAGWAWSEASWWMGAIKR